MLFPGTIVAGCAIALVNVLLPSMVKRRRPDLAGLMIGLYLTTLTAGAVVGAVIAVPVFTAAGGRGPAARAGRQADARHVGACRPWPPCSSGCRSCEFRTVPVLRRRAARRARDGQDPAGLAGHGVHEPAEPVVLRDAVLVPHDVQGSRDRRVGRREPAGADERRQRDHRADRAGARAPGQGPAALAGQRGGDPDHDRAGRVGLRAELRCGRSSSACSASARAARSG